MDGYYDNGNPLCEECPNKCSTCASETSCIGITLFIL